MNLSDLILTFFVILGWSLSYVVVKFGLDHFPPILLVTLRFTLIGIILWPFYRTTKLTFKQLLPVAFLKCLYHIFIYIGVSKGIDISTTTIAAQMSVPISVIFSAIFLRESMTNKHVIGILLAFIGLVIILGEPNVVKHMYAFFLVILSAICSAAMNIVMKKVKADSALEFVCWSSIMSIIPLFIYSYLSEDYNLINIIKTAPLDAHLSILYMVIITSIFSFSNWYKLIHKYSVNQIVPFSLLIPFFGVIAAVILFNEPLTFKIIFGGIFIIIGVGIISLVKKEDNYDY